jgi:hypothetical protein
MGNPIVEQLVAKSRTIVSGAVGLLGDMRTDSVERARVLLSEAAEVAIRKAAGEDVALAEAALESSTTSLGREKQAMIVAEGKALALRAALDTIQILAAAAAGG